MSYKCFWTLTTHFDGSYETSICEEQTFHACQILFCTTCTLLYLNKPQLIYKRTKVSWCMQFSTTLLWVLEMIMLRRNTTKWQTMLVPTGQTFSCVLCTRFMFILEIRKRPGAIPPMSSLGLCLSEANNVPLFLFESKPWSCLSKTEMCPVNDNFAKEVVRQARILCVHPPMPQPPNWPKS